MTKTVPLLHLDRLQVGYGEHRVCGEISLDIGRGASVAMVGANGTGKSSTLRTIVGQLPRLGGTAIMNGAPIDERSASFRAAVATVFDEDAFFPSLTVGEHLTLVATGHQVADARGAVARELAFFGLAAAETVFPANLSSGQRRRMLLAAAFVRPSELLCLDEPEQRLDQGMRRRLAARLRETTRAGTTIVFATHDPEFVTTCSDTALMISDAVSRLDPAAGAEALRTL